MRHSVAQSSFKGLAKLMKHAEKFADRTYPRTQALEEPGYEAKMEPGLGDCF